MRTLLFHKKGVQLNLFQFNCTPFSCLCSIFTSSYAFLRKVAT